MIEAWESAEDLEAHLQTEHVQEYLKMSEEKGWVKQVVIKKYADDYYPIGKQLNE